MNHEGMVHALEQIHRLLQDDGCLIDIHPVRAAPLIKIYQGSKVLFSEPSPGYDNYAEDIRHAEDALAKVIQRHLFVIERSDVFEFLTYGSSVVELNDYFDKASAFDDSPIDQEINARREALYARTEEIMQVAGEGAEIVVHERAQIARLRR